MTSIVTNLNLLREVTEKKIKLIKVTSDFAASAEKETRQIREKYESVRVKREEDVKSKREREDAVRASDNELLGTETKVDFEACRRTEDKIYEGKWKAALEKELKVQKVAREKIEREVKDQLEECIREETSLHISLMATITQLSTTNLALATAKSHLEKTLHETTTALSASQSEATSLLHENVSLENSLLAREQELETRQSAIAAAQTKISKAIDESREIRNQLLDAQTVAENTILKLRNEVMRKNEALERAEDRIEDLLHTAQIMRPLQEVGVATRLVFLATVKGIRHGVLPPKNGCRTGQYLRGNYLADRSLLLAGILPSPSHEVDFEAVYQHAYTSPRATDPKFIEMCDLWGTMMSCGYGTENTRSGELDERFRMCWEELEGVWGECEEDAGGESERVMERWSGDERVERGVFEMRRIVGEVVEKEQKCIQNGVQG